MYHFAPKIVATTYGEIIKYALISGNSLWNEIRELKSINNLMPDRIINQCIEIKDYYVKQDLNELNIRKVLNFGHTIGHAMETFFSSSNRNLFHGEAVAIGIIIESIISNNILGFPEEDLVTIIKYIHRIFPKLSFSDTDIEALLDIMLKDKKNFSGSINFTLIKGIGNAKIDNYIDKDEIRLALSEYSKI